MKLKFIDKLIIVLLILAVMLFCVSCEKEQETIGYQPQPTTFVGQDLDFFNLVNAMRVSRGLPTLKSELILTQNCEVHANYMNAINDMNHDYFWARYVQSFANNFGEVVSQGFINAPGIISAYQNSPDHYSILISPEFTHIGIANVNRFQCVNLASYGSGDNKKQLIKVENLTHQP
ncbi:CAP domain-containing protein [Flavobacterium sp. 102]|uniref:CAP domain-containing protein n=1 Tax=Flavobacterium sp. 102 TaxID=2135623 RepID=UPI000EB55B22|nr:CAP domain-containing protein [Flavobacterium sp. 102]RKS00406.1 hypothetical protein C8C84_0014 [Flavobacterium sp. 102]RKS03732.1 hypothetical protein C8C84_3498 [Flavobacterium sp. 102]